MAADAENHKLFTEACRKNLDTYQSLYDDSSKSLYARVDLIYNFVCNQELKKLPGQFYRRTSRTDVSLRQFKE